jgi:hypothetical protein
MAVDAAEAGVRSDEEESSWPEGPDRQYYGYVIIEWPAPQRKDGTPRPMAAWGCTILDPVTGQPITTVEKITLQRVTADARNAVIADLAMLADPDGNPVMGPDEDGKHVVWPDENGKIRTGVFPFLVAEMRVRGDRSCGPGCENCDC